MKCPSRSLPFWIVLVVAAATSGCNSLLGPLPGPPTLFEQMDADHDGKLSRAEFSAGFADAMLTVHNLSREGLITPAQWNSVERPGRAGSSFGRLDENHDGKLSRAEMSSGRERDAAVNAIFDRIDTNHDGYISREEGHLSQLDLTPRERAQRNGS